MNTNRDQIAAVPAAATPWWLVLIEAIAAILIGFLLLINPGSTLIVLVRLLGFYFLITGVLSLISIFIDSTAWGWKLFSGLLGILAGIVIIEYPLWATLIVPATFVWVIGIFAVLIGIMQLIQAFRGGGWGLGVLGALSILLGIAMLGRLWLATLSLPLVLGILGIAGGVLALFAAFRLRAEQAASPAPLLQESDMAEPEPEEQMPPPEAVQEPEAAADPDLGFLGLTSQEDLEKFNQSLEYIEGIGPVYAEKLAGLGIHNLLEFLHQGASPAGRNEIAKKSDISGLLILEWINHIDLYRIKGVGSEYADLLEEAGVDTVMELAHRNPANLYDKMSSVNEVKHLVRKLPAQNQIEDWVAQAKELPRVIEY